MSLKLIKYAVNYRNNISYHMLVTVAGITKQVNYVVVVVLPACEVMPILGNQSELCLVKSTVITSIYGDPLFKRYPYNRMLWSV